MLTSEVVRRLGRLERGYGGLYGRLWGDAASEAQLPRLTLSLTWRTE